MLIFSKKNSKISKCFYDHNQNVADCFENLEKFFDILFSEKPDRNLLESAKIAIDSCEHAADVELRHTVDVMRESFLPATRSHLISLVQCTDEVANQIQSIARQIFLEKIVIPAELQHDVKEILAITKEQLELLYVAIDKVVNDFGSFLKDKKLLDDIRTEESRVDSIETMLHTRIFDLDISLCEKIYYRDLIESICQISDIIEDISDRIQVMVVEREG